MALTLRQERKPRTHGNAVEVDGVVFYPSLDGRRWYLDPPVRVKVPETSHRRGHTRVEFTEVKSPRVLRRIRRQVAKDEKLRRRIRRMREEAALHTKLAGAK